MDPIGYPSSPTSSSSDESPQALREDYLRLQLFYQQLQDQVATANAELQEARGRKRRTDSSEPVGRQAKRFKPETLESRLQDTLNLLLEKSCRLETKEQEVKEKETTINRLMADNLCLRLRIEMLEGKLPNTFQVAMPKE